MGAGWIAPVPAHLVLTPGTPEVIVTTYAQRLIAFAEQLKAQPEHPELAVVVAMMAFEIAAEHRLRRAAAASPERVAAKHVVEGIRGALSNMRNRHLYVVMTGDHIERAPFWSDFIASSKLRNKLVHMGGTATPEQIETAIAVARRAVPYLEGDQGHRV